MINDHCIDHPSRSHNLITSNFTAPPNPPAQIFGTFYHCSDENPQLQVLTKRFSGLSPSGHSPPSQHCHGHRNSHCRQCHRLCTFTFQKSVFCSPIVIHHHPWVCSHGYFVWSSHLFISLAPGAHKAHCTIWALSSTTSFIIISSRPHLGKEIMGVNPC